ncbi:PFL_4703 family integrating conjugative element protein [Endozoicomonas sp. ALC066]|uniref:PFL_4703 family integrating conjugative element protein n=1 Tax=Endozoicomonas sp. ALC066 TaxID=3403078 RepID=UPI003BB787ED
MSKTRKAVSARDQHIFSLRIIIVVLGLIICGLIFGWMRAPDKLTVHVPPDLRTGSIREVGEIPPANVYAFALYIFQQLNRWPEDGNDDYLNQINRLSCFMTPKFKNNRKADYQSRKSRFELNGRERSIHEIPGYGYDDKRVYIESDDSWVVYLDLQINESLSGKNIKNSLIRYPLRVVRYDVDAECNPWGLALDGFTEDTSPLKAAKGVKVEN